MDHSLTEIAAVALKRTFAQPAGQALPQEFLAMLVALDRAKQQPTAR